ncbi:ankyrin repeat domain-containing protein 26 isoform X5 [Bufo bufo]|uniref:ankyrin repeat domain-containing protein 26 isoform X5 n=1 Tax=Bufo bufo TaxID=8384 RepID=UPI001ABE5DB6|nr:ankyrin repeat domain-containing protein 26 isoform X5 [Bufo bufo]
MKKIFGFGRKKKSGPSSSTSETGSVLSAGYELKEKDLSKFQRAASSGDVAKTRQLLPKQDINQVDKENRTPLHLACANGHLDVVKLLVENKAKLNVCDNDSRSPLMKAIQCQHEPCATILLEHQADPNVVDVNENAALHLAALIPSMTVAVQLLEHGANINAVNKDGCTPLILAVTENHQEMVELLIKEGADINSRDSNGRTSLMIAASNGHISLVKYLLQNQADSSVKDLTGWTADDYAVNDGHHACSQLIFEHVSRSKTNSSPHYGANKKGTSVVGRFTLGSPATDKEGADASQAESESSRATEDADSWPSDDEDDLDFSPKKTAKPSLTQLLHTKKNIIEKGSFTSVQPKGFTLESKSDGEEDSVHDSEDEGANIQSPPQPFPQARSFPHPVCIKPASLAKPSQLASASLFGVNKDESLSGDEVDESVKQSVRTDTSHPEKVQASGEGNGRKVALMTELGFEDDESPWDSESASDSPRKQSASDVVPTSVQAHMQCISEESNEDMYYCPSFPKQSRICKIPDEGWHFRPREASENSTAVKALDTKKDSFLQTKEGSTSNFFMTISEKNKPDLMADLGLDDADDIEDASDWDSTSHSFKCAPHTSPSHKLHENSSPQTGSGKFTSKDNNTSHPAFLCSVPEDESEDRMQSGQNKGIPKEISQKGKTGLTNGDQLTNAINNIPVGREQGGNLSRQGESEKSKGGDNKTGLQVEPRIELNAKSKTSSHKGNNEVEKSMSSHADDKAPSKKEKHPVNGSMLDAFDESSLSEISQEEDGRSSGKRTEKQKINEDVADYSQSSDTATEDSELPTSAFTNAMLLIKQLNLDGQDSLTSLKIQNILHEYERVIEKEKGRRALLSREVKKLRRERKEMQQIMEENRELKFLLEHHKVEWESDLNNLRLTLKQEEEKRKSAEMLYDKSKEQLRKKEDHCCKEMEEKQHLELTLRNLELEMRSLKNNMKQVEEERTEAQRLYAQELNARVLNESALNNLKKKNAEEEAKKIKTKHDEQILSQSPETNEKEKDLAMRNVTLQEEVTTLKVEMENMRSRCQEEESRYMDENEMLKEKIEDLRKDLKMNEETLTQTVIHYNGQLNALKTEAAMMCSKVEHEKQSKERLETELEAVRSRLNSTIQDLERSQALKTDTERTLQRERDEWLRSKDKLTHELSNLRESHSNLSQQLSKAESKLNGSENELHRTGLSLQDKTLLLDNSQRDLTQAQSKIKDLEHGLQVEKDHNNKNSVKLESMNERLAQITSENMQLRQQLEDVQNRGIIKEKTVSDVQDRFTDLYSKLRADTERQVHIVEERNKDLITKSNELREQLYKLETEKVERESTIRQLQQELADALKKLSMSEASFEVTSRYRNDLEEEKQQLQKELEKFRIKLQDLEDQFIQSERCNHQLNNALGDKERELIAAFQKVQEFSSAATGADKAVKQLEEHVQKLEIENARIEATAKQQAGQIESLQKELHESVSMRNRLEDLITNLQSTKIGLEEKLNQQVHKQSALSQNAQDSQNLWETELKSRSQIGVRLAELEGLNATFSDQLSLEKKKLKKLAEQKKSIEERFDQEMKRSNKLQQEVAGLKKLLKTAKKKLKDFEGTEQKSGLGEGSRNFGTDSEVLRMKAKIVELSSQMEKESRRYMEVESINRDLQEEVSTNKKLYRNIEKLERGKRQLEEELAELKRSIESSKMSQSYLDVYKKEVDERGRQELRQQLEEVNLFLQAHAASQDKLEQMRAENDASVRIQMEHRIQDLESELHRIKNTQLENTSERDSNKQDMNRLKELYSEEQKARKSLTSKLERANERLAEANSKLLNERQRSKSLIASTFLNGSMGASPVVDTSHLARLSSNLPFSRSLGLPGGLLNTVGNGLAVNQVESYFTKMQQELEKNIAKELDQANAELETGCTRISPVGSIAGSLRNLNADQDPVSRATQQYLEVLKKNYMI